jgi:nucleotide-binding universal stress UspA family protein
MDDALFERILVPLADPEDAARTARSLRPHVEDGTSLVITHVAEGSGPDLEIARGRDRFAEETYETFIDVLDREGVELEWVTLRGREVAETVLDGTAAVEATLIAFVPRGLDRWARIIAGDPASRLIQHADVPVMVFPDRVAALEEE